MANTLQTSSSTLQKQTLLTVMLFICSQQSLLACTSFLLIHRLACNVMQGAYNTLLMPSYNAMFVLQWNPVEKEWDCPCHGSCFDKKGKQLAGPATTDMRPPQIVTD